MHQGEPYGHLAFGGIGVKEEEISSMIPCPIPPKCNGSCNGDVTRYIDVTSALQELKKYKIFSVNDDGIMYSRRMVRDGKNRVNTRNRVKKHRDTANQCNANVTPHVTQMKRGDPDPYKKEDLLSPSETLNSKRSRSKSRSKKKRSDQDLKTSKGSSVPGARGWLASEVSWEEFCSGCSWDKELQEVVLNGNSGQGLREHLEAFGKEHDLAMPTKEEMLTSWGMMSSNFAADARKRGKNLPVQIRGWCQNDMRLRKGRGWKKPAGEDPFEAALREAEEKEGAIDA